MSGVAKNPPVYEVDVYSADSTINITSIGVWLPQGFTYVNGSSNLPSGQYIEQVLPCAGNQAVIWTFTGAPTPTYSSLQASMSETGSSYLSIDFTYSTSSARLPPALGWITASQSGSGTPTYAWNADVNVTHITAEAGETLIESYIPVSQTRALGNAMAGDYVATGNSLMTMAGAPSGNGIRTVTLSHSSASIGSSPAGSEPSGNNIPTDASVEGAYLYWSGWLQSSTETLGTRYGEYINFEINGNQVSDASGSPGLSSQPIFATRTQTAANGSGSGDYSYSCYKDVTTLVKTELERESSATTWVSSMFNVGAAVGCTLGDTGNEWSYAGWSIIIVYSSPETLGHQLYLYDTFMYAPSTGQTSMGYGTTSSRGSDIDLTGNTTGPGGTISGFLVPQPIPGETNAAKLTCFVGEGDWCYSGDFIALNANTSNPWGII